MSNDNKVYFVQKYDGDTVTVTTSAESSLEDVLGAFERFLRGAGYYFDGHIDIVYDEDTKEEDTEDWITPESPMSAAWPFPGGSSDWESSINLDLQNMAAAGPTLTVSDDIDFTNINLDMSLESSEPTIRFTDTDKHTDYYYEFDRHGRQDIASISTEQHPIYTAEQIREMYSNGSNIFHSER